MSRSGSWRHRLRPAVRYALAVVLVAAALLGTVTVKESIDAAYFETPFFFCAIVLASWLGGLGTGLTATLLSIWCINFFFAVPPHRLTLGSEDLPRFFVFMLAGSFISWLGWRQRTDEVALLLASENLEKIVRDRTADLRISNEKLMQAEQAKAAALAEERNRMAADVHDMLAQAFAATLLHLRSMDMRETSAELRSQWRFAQETTAEGLAAARRAMNTVRQLSASTGSSLAHRLKERVQHCDARCGARINVHLEVQGAPLELPWGAGDELEYLAAEALFNAERHAAAREIAVQLDFMPEQGALRLGIRDDGRGFDLERSGGPGLGLRAMQERAERVGAKFTLITEPGRGTEIVVQLGGLSGNQSE